MNFCGLFSKPCAVYSENFIGDKKKKAGKPGEEQKLSSKRPQVPTSLVETTLTFFFDKPSIQYLKYHAQESCLIYSSIKQSSTQMQTMENTNPQALSTKAPHQTSENYIFQKDKCLDQSRISRHPKKAEYAEPSLLEPGESSFKYKVSINDC